MLQPDLISGYQGYFRPNIPVSIAQSATDSGAIQCGGFLLCGISMPSIFTGTALTFLVGNSVDGYQANGEILFGGTTANDDTITINGVAITFKTADPTGNEVLIGGTAAETAQNLKDFLDATDDDDLLACTYSISGALITVTAVVHGTAGNAYTFAKSSSDITLTPSGGVLTGGGFRPLYSASNSLVSMTVAAGRCYAVDPANFTGVQFLKLRSGSTELNARTITCTLKG